MELCEPLKEMMQESEEKGRREGEMWGKVTAYHDAGWSARKIADRLNLSEKKVESMLK